MARQGTWVMGDDLGHTASPESGQKKEAAPVVGRLALGRGGTWI